MSFWSIVVLMISLGSCFSDAASDGAVVTLDTISIFKTHEWLHAKPSVYFLCVGENKTHLPDVKDVNVSYAFKGQESWQPLTNFTNNKCKRCGFYEEDRISSDDVFGVWELCPSEFSRGKYKKVVEGEFSATFLCGGCSDLSKEGDSTSESDRQERASHVVLSVVIILVVSSVVALGLFAIYKYWQKRKREQDQARFLKLFEDGDDPEDELGLGTVI